MQLDHHPKGDEIQDYLKDITGKSSDAASAESSSSCSTLGMSSSRIFPQVSGSAYSGR